MRRLTLTIFSFVAFFFNSPRAFSMLNCTPPGTPVISPSALTCQSTHFTQSFRPKATSTSLAEVYLENIQSCNLNNNLNNLIDLQPSSIRSSQVVMLEDNWKKEYTKTNVDCSTGIAVCTGLGYELCHGTTVPGTCTSGTCDDPPNATCSIDSNCSKKVYRCYDKIEGVQNDGDTNDMAFYKTSVLHQILIPANSFSGMSGASYALTGGEVYFRSVSAGSFTYKDYPLSFRMPCYGEVYFTSFSPNNIAQIQTDSDFSSSPKGQSLSCPKTVSKGSLINLNNTDRFSGDAGVWPENFCGENPSTNEINQTNSNFKSGFYSGIVFKCDLDNYNGPVGSSTSAIQDIDWYVFPETNSYLSSPESLTILDNRFIRSNNARTMFKFQSDFFTHLLGSDSNGVSYGGLITEQNDLLQWFPETLDSGSPTNWVSLLTNCNDQGCNSSTSSLFDTLDPSIADHKLSDTTVMDHMNNISAVPTTSTQRSYFKEIPDTIRNGIVAPTADEEIVAFDNNKKLNINRERFINNLEIISEVFGDTYTGCDGSNGSNCPKQEYQVCSYTMLGSNCEYSESTQIKGDSVACCPDNPALSSGDGVCIAKSLCGQPKSCPNIGLVDFGESFDIKIEEVPETIEDIYNPPVGLNIPIEFDPIIPYEWRDIPTVCGDWVPYYYINAINSSTYTSTINYKPKVANPVIPNKLFAYIITQHKTEDTPYSCDRYGPNENIPFNVSSNALMYNKVVGSDSYDFEGIVGTSSSEVINGKLYMSNVISSSYQTNYAGAGGINTENGAAACSGTNFGHCSWTAYCTQNPTDNNFFTGEKQGLSNCVMFSYPKVHGYVH